MIHLDTSFLIRALLRGSAQDRKLRGWLHEGVGLAMSSVAWAEFLCGPVEPVHVELASRVVAERVALVEEDAALAARLFNLSGRRRGTLADCMIAATALRAGSALATVNPEDFRALESAGLTIVPS